MKPEPRFFILMGIVMVIVCIAAAFLAFSPLISTREYINLPVHSTLETLGGISALLIAMALLQQNRGGANDSFFMVGTGFICMGTLDTFHAMSMPGDAFIFLHSAASLAGGFFFAWIFLPPRVLPRSVTEQRWIAGLSMVICVSVGLRAILMPTDVPKIIQFYDGRFTLTAILINTLASVLFLASAPKYYFRYRESRNSGHLLFMCLALLFGLAELIFQYSDTWNGIWWAWHLVRFTAYIMTLYYVVGRHVQLPGSRH